jgi:hypothetical protein
MRSTDPGPWRGSFTATSLLFLCTLLASGIASANHCPNVAPNLDFDGDGICDAPFDGEAADNCTETPNPNQYNVAQQVPDACGNVCDQDYNQNDVVDLVDVGMVLIAISAVGNPLFECADTHTDFPLINMFDVVCSLINLGDDPCL